MDRDRRLTGMLRGQSDTVRAPAGFELNNPWRVVLSLNLGVEDIRANTSQMEPTFT